jgi:hypothetical protein
MNLIHLAFRFKCIDFMNMKCIKTILNKKWHDNADPKTTKYIVSNLFISIRHVCYFVLFLIKKNIFILKTPTNKVCCVDNCSRFGTFFDCIQHRK